VIQIPLVKPASLPPVSLPNPTCLPYGCWWWWCCWWCC